MEWWGKNARTRHALTLTCFRPNAFLPCNTKTRTLQVFSRQVEKEKGRNSKTGQRQLVVFRCLQPFGPRQKRKDTTNKRRKHGALYVSWFCNTYDVISKILCVYIFAFKPRQPKWRKLDILSLCRFLMLCHAFRLAKKNKSQVSHHIGIV